MLRRRHGTLQSIAQRILLLLLRGMGGGGEASPGPGTNPNPLFFLCPSLLSCASVLCVVGETERERGWVRILPLRCKRKQIGRAHV